MEDFRLWQREKARAGARRGLVKRGLIGCISFDISVGLAYLAYWWLSNNVNLRGVLSIPRRVPGWLVDGVGFLILMVVVQAALILSAGALWKLTGKDKKVADKMDDLLKEWDEIEE